MSVIISDTNSISIVDLANLGNPSFSDFGHEMVTAVLPMYLATLGLGPAALGAMEGAADLAFSLSKLAGGAVGHRLERKRPWAAGGYLLTTIGTRMIALVNGLDGGIDRPRRRGE
jgi:MFS family permease